jgi:hypothetical protein
MARAKIKGTEDEERTLLYIDVLGFADLTKAFRTRVETHRDRKTGFVGSSITPIQSQIIGFHNAIDRWIFHESLYYGNVIAMLFSDCAYIDAGNSMAAALLAQEIMRECIQKRVPVRMGLGRGTFYPLNFSTENAGNVQISRSRFIGTAAVFAHAAEQSGGKGMRVFLHPSVVPDLQGLSSRVKVLPIQKPFRNATHEVDYLHEPTPMGRTPSADDQDRTVFQIVKEMEDPAAPLKIRRQYIETIKALNRMRRAHGRKPVSVRRRP